MYSNTMACLSSVARTTSTSLVKGYIPQSHIKALINQKVKLLDEIDAIIKEVTEKTQPKKKGRRLNSGSCRSSCCGEEEKGHR